MLNRTQPTLMALAAIAAQLAAASAGAAYTGPALASKTTDSLGKPYQSWEALCSADGSVKANSHAIPKPNYKNPLVASSTKTLSEQVKALSYYFYSPVLKLYKLGSNGKLVAPPADAPAGTTPEANAYMVYLCGEFRDRPTMVQEKLNWIGKIYKLPYAAEKVFLTQDAGSIDWKTTSPWSVITARAYQPYLEMSRQVFEARNSRDVGSKTYDLGQKTADTAGKIPPIPTVNGESVCEAKYIIAQYVAKGEKFKTIKEFDEGYAKFKGNCGATDEEFYYDFRGDSNFKPNSPEANGMIWFASSTLAHCKRDEATGLVKASDDKATDKECATYASKPFASRWNGNRAGLATWLFRARDEKVNTPFASEGESVSILPRAEGVDIWNGPMGFKFQSWDEQTGDSKESRYTLANGGFMPEWKANLSKFWAQGDMGFNTLTGLGGKTKLDIGLAYTRLRDAVDRHTDWYASAFDDERGMMRDQAYSPFVASSYEMSASDGFTAPGVTVQSPSDGRKHWMFVFKIAKKNWYNSDRLEASKKTADPVNFDTMWFDETSLGTNGLARSEHAWDRMGTALESEMDSIIYLHNITTGHQVMEPSTEPNGAN